MDEREDYLAHYGVLGMKWGVRNEETRRRYEHEKRVSARKEKRAQVKAEKKQLKEIRKDRRRTAAIAPLKSDQEINTLHKRLEKERDIQKWTYEELHPYATKAKKVMNSPVGRTAIGIVSPVAVGLGTYAVKRYMRNAQYTLPEGVHGPVYKEPWSWADVSKYIANPAKKK